MAQRRMFSIKVLDSARFIKMPPSTQALYFHLGLRADDDGIVEAFNIMRLINATEDDLKILVAKGYITVLNEDLVTYINDWKEHNYIRADRKVDSIYKHLLIQLLDNENQEIQDVQPNGSHDEEERQPNDNQVTTKRPHRLGKDRLGKDKLGKDRLEEGKESKETIKTLIDAYASPGGELNKTILDYVEMRIALKKKPTPRALKMIFNKLDKLADDEYTKIKILEQSILKSWTDVYQLKENINTNGNSSGVNQKIQGLNNWLNGGSTK